MSNSQERACPICEKVCKTPRALRSHISSKGKRDKEHQDYNQTLMQQAQIQTLMQKRQVSHEEATEIVIFENRRRDRRCAWCALIRDCQCKIADKPKRVDPTQWISDGWEEIHVYSVEIALPSRVCAVAPADFSKITKFPVGEDCFYDIPFKGLTSPTSKLNICPALDTLCAMLTLEPAAQAALWVYSGLFQKDACPGNQRGAEPNPFRMQLIDFFQDEPWSDRAKYVYPGDCSTNISWQVQVQIEDSPGFKIDYDFQTFIPQLLADARQYFKNTVLLVQRDRLDGLGTLASNVVVEALDLSEIPWKESWMKPVEKA